MSLNDPESPRQIKFQQENTGRASANRSEGDLIDTVFGAGGIGLFFVLSFLTINHKLIESGSNWGEFFRLLKEGLQK